MNYNKKNHRCDITRMRAIKYIAVFLFVNINMVQANVSGQNVNLNLSFENATLKSVLEEIKAQSEFDFVYNALNIDDNGKISVHVENASIETALNACLAGTDIDFILKGKVIVLQKKEAKKALPQANGREIKGRVVDVKNQPVPGVSVRLNGTSLGVATDMAGYFVLNIPDMEDVELVFSFVGMEPVTYKVKDNREIKIVMKESAEELGEVIVTGMEVIKKDRMTGSASVITANDLKAQGITSVDRILEGMVSGLNSTTLSGAPGTRAKITIRGENNLSGHTEPLWIVDGLPLMSGVPVNNTGDYAGTIMQDGVGNIMPEDIESISILKDASAAAIYGAKAANGVIVITTKKGFRSKTQISYSGTYECAVAPKADLGFMNSSEKLRYEKAIIDNFGLGYANMAGRGGNLYRRMLQGLVTPAQYDTQLNKMKNTETDWFKVLFRTAQSHSHNVSLRGGTEEMTYYTSLNFQQKNGILLPNNYTNAGLLMKLDYRPVKNLILALNVSANTRRNEDQASAINPFNYAVFANPYERPYDENGDYAADLSYLPRNYTQETASGYIYDQFNIIREMKETQRTQTGLDADFTFDIRYEVIPGLTLESILRKGVSYNTEMTEVGDGTYTSLVNDQFASLAYPRQEVLPGQYNDGDLSENSGRNYNWSIRNQIDYSFDIADTHLFSVLVATETTSRKFNNFGYTSPMYHADYRITGVPSFDNNPLYEDMRSAVGNMFSTNEGQDRTVSFLGALRYGYKDRYIVSFNYRADGADVVGNDNRFTPLWSAGLRYNLHHEKFFQNNIVNELAIRGSYGYTGNIDRTALPFSMISFGSDTYMGNRYIDGFEYPNPTVRWEKKRDRNLGIDIGLLDNMINITADYYSNRTDDVLENLDVPVSTGRTRVRANGGVVENSGLELYLNVRWVNRKDFSFSTSVNASRNKNVIKKSFYDYKSYKEMVSGTAVKGGITNIVGEETGGVYGWETAGVNPVTGSPRYCLTEDGKRAYARFIDAWDTYSDSKKERYSQMVGDFSSIPDYVDFGSEDYLMPSLQYLGRSNPKYVGGFSTYIRYKGLEFSTQWTFKTGHIIPAFNDYQNAPNNWDNPDQAAAGYSSDLCVSGTNRQKKYLSFWKAPGDITDVPNFVTSGTDHWSMLHTSDKYENGNFLRMTNLSLNYRFPELITKKLKMKNMSVAFNARNLLTFTKYRGLDVGSGGAFTYPVSREFNIKLSVGF